MDRTETHYTTVDAEGMWREIHETYIKAGGDVLYPGDEKEILLRAVQAIALAVLSKVDTAHRMNTLRYAIGEFLKLYGEKRNCYYTEAVPATATVRITFRASGIEQVIPAGTELTADGKIIYALAEDIEQVGAAQVIQTIIICQTPGTIGNGLHEGTQMQLMDSNDAISSIIVTGSAAGGTDAEDMEAYRERIRNFGLASVTTGPMLQYESRTREVSTSILDARALNDGPAEVGIYLILAEGADRQSLFDSVQQKLSAYDTRPLTDHVTIYEAESVPYTLNVRVWCGAYTKLDGSIQDVIDAYQAWQDNRIGRAFNPDRLIANLYQLGIDRVRLLEGSGIDGSTEYQEIGMRQRCLGKITLEVVNT